MSIVAIPEEFRKQLAQSIAHTQGQVDALAGHKPLTKKQLQEKHDNQEWESYKEGYAVGQARKEAMDKSRRVKGQKP